MEDDNISESREDMIAFEKDYEEIAVDSSGGEDEDKKY